MTGPLVASLLAVCAVLAGGIGMFAGALKEARNDRDQWRRRADTLLDQLNGMRRDGYVVPKPHKVGQPPPDTDDLGKERAESMLRRQHFIRSAIAQMRREHPKLTDAQLEAESERLYELTFQQDVPT